VDSRVVVWHRLDPKFEQLEPPSTPRHTLISGPSLGLTGRFPPLGDGHGAARVAWQSAPDIDCWSDPIHFSRLPFSVPKRHRIAPLPLGHLLRHNRVAACHHSV